MKISLEALLSQAAADEIGGEAKFELVASRHPRTRNLEFQVRQDGRDGPVGNYLLTGSIVTPLDREAGTDG
ncbi:hypothetical protein OSH11_21615 [Kaistia dalseonensis]|uniref:Uncharacterized protein n=1 Tax=Kaistia dalseonensis TaxID=410840 RepID=A0ABU0HDC1_9HYPH|nr:hypothetical protein [Kaistia dalseonensis]MCX5497310.1 hypothetical protein [Kaistia dalseonensis]MDQ0439947.1 hypothetical protein [Kaistia dalseonensis]